MKKLPIIVIKKSRKIPEIEVVFTPDVEMKIIHCEKGYARGIHPEPTAKRKAKIKYSESWKI